MPTLDLKIKNNREVSYPIIIEENLLENPQLFNELIVNKQIAIITNETVAPIYLNKIKDLLKNKELLEIILPDGEKHKNLKSFATVMDKLLENRLARDCGLIALGGGVIGDLTGFVAASYQRGVDFYQIPTTLLAQVDSSVGGKTGINHPQGKNMIGAFWQPKAVFIDPKTLTSLDAREFSAGMGEIIKYGLINDKSFFEWLEENITEIMLKKPELLSSMIAHCCQNKADIVAKDEKEAGIRALLNLGHTFGHSLETLTNYEFYKHGEAVAVGIRIAAELALLENKISESEKKRIIELLKKANLPYFLGANLEIKAIYEAMFLDKKVKNKKLRIVAFSSFCNCEVRADILEENIIKALENSRQN